MVAFATEYMTVESPARSQNRAECFFARVPGRVGHGAPAVRLNAGEKSSCRYDACRGASLAQEKDGKIVGVVNRNEDKLVRTELYYDLDNGVVDEAIVAVDYYDAIAQAAELSESIEIAEFRFYGHSNSEGQGFGPRSILTVDQVASFGKYLSGNGKLHLYGCSVASGKNGRGYIDSIARSSRVNAFGHTGLKHINPFGMWWRHLWGNPAGKWDHFDSEYWGR